MYHAGQPVPSSLPEISMFWPSTTEPSRHGGWQFGALTRSKKITSPERTSRDCLLIRFSEIPFKPSLDRHSFADSRESDSEKIRRPTVTDCKSVYLALAVQREHPLTRLSEDECSCSGGVRFASHPLADVRVAQRTSHDPYTV